MKQLEIGYIVTQGKIPESVAQALLDGVSQADLESILCTEYGLASDSSQLSITRMNTIGGLRAMGYDVTGGRKGRGQPYKIVGWAEKTYAPTADQWTGEANNAWRWVRTLKRITTDDEQRVRQALSTRAEMNHENCWLYPFTYELAKDSGWWYEAEPGECMIIMQRFESYPRMRIFNLTASPKTLIETARFLAACSTKTVYIVNCQTDLQKEFKQLDPGGSWGKRVQAIYRVSDLLDDPKKFFGKRGWEMIRSHDKRIKYLESNEADQMQIIAEWRKINEPKMRQLAITRDFVAVRTPSSEKTTLVGYRDMTYGFTSVTPENPVRVPVCMHILDQHASFPNVACQIVEKSQNYTSQPGGKPGTADWNLWKTCQVLRERGIEYLQVGGRDGGGEGLPVHKDKFTYENISSLTFYTSFESGAPK